MQWSPVLSAAGSGRLESWVPENLETWDPECRRWWAGGSFSDFQVSSTAPNRGAGGLGPEQTRRTHPGSQLPEAAFDADIDNAAVWLCRSEGNQRV